MSKLGLLAALLIGACGGSGLGADVRTDISARMTSAQTPISACYTDALKSDRHIQGMLVLQFAAAPTTGQFTDITVTHDELKNPGLDKCVIDEVGKLKLDKPQKTRVSVPSYPIHFQPNK